MSNVNFSLTEQIVINPVLELRAAPLNTPENPLTFSGRVKHFFKSEVATRIIAIATSFFAAIDFMVHLGTGIVKGAHLGLRKLGIRCLSPAPSSAEISHHFKQSAKFLGITVIGSIAATVWPGVLKYFRVSPLSPRGSSSADWKSTSETVQNLWTQAADKKVFDKLWKNASINDRRTFVHLLDKDSSNKAIKAKSELINTIYRKITQNPGNQWPTQKGVDVFYHATSRKNLKKIIESGRLEVRWEQRYSGAFVSTKPETGFGNYILVFNRNIERLSHLNHGFSVENAYWAGFSHDIPVNAMTLNGILIYNEKYGEVFKLQKSYSDWAGQGIEVKPLSQQNSISGDKEIPKEWPGDDPNASAIQQTMKIRVKQRQAQKVKQAISVPATRQKVRQRQMILAQ